MAHRLHAPSNFSAQPFDRSATMICLQGSAVRLPDELSIPRWERAVRTVAGAGFACAAVGNAVAFLPKAEEQLAWFRDTAWLPPYPRVLNRLTEIAPLTVGSAVVYESAVAALLLSRRHETTALGLATVWVVGLIPAIGWPYWLANVPLGLGLGALWWRSPAGRRRQLDASE